MIFDMNYNRQEFLRILQTRICPDFLQDIKPLECSRQTKFIKDAIFQLGTIKFNDYEVSVLEIKQISWKDPRITLTKDAFKLLHDHQKDNALIVFRSDNTKTWRLSLLTSKYEWRDKVNSNPKRYSFLLGEGEKTKTPEKYLIDKWVIKSFDELVNRFDVEVVRKEFFKLYMNLFLELYGEIQNNPTFHILIEQRKIEPVSFAKNLMGKMIFLYFIQKKWRLGITDRNKNFGEWDRDFFRNNFDKLAHDADLFQKSMNFYNDFLEPLFYSGLNKKNNDDRHPKLNMKVPYLNWWLFQEEYDRKNTVIKLDNGLFKNLIRSFDTYNFTIDEDDAHDREIAVDPEMLGKIFESMISVSKGNINQIMEVYRDEKIAKKITHPNPETILNIDIWKEINKKFWAFYTPREIVHYMTKESLLYHIINKLHNINPSQGESELENIIRKLFEYKDKHLTKQEIESEKSDGYELLKRYVFDIQESLKSLKILDPAAWSGAFPMGILQEILWLRRYLIDNFELKTESDFEIKKQIVQNSIYWVDIDPGAIDIARLRFRLSLIVDAIEPVPLPNLDFKFVCANSLIPLESSSLFTKQNIIDELARLRLEYFVCSDLAQKEILKREFRVLQLDLSWFWSKMKNEFKSTKEWRKYIEEIVKQNADYRNRQIMERDPFDSSSSNWWFDTQMMFGVEWFDIVIGNPPYLSVKDMTIEEKNKFKTLYKTAVWQFDLYWLFYEKWFSLLKDYWNIIYISSSTFINNKDFKDFREFYLKRSTIKCIINLWETVFESANIDVAIFLMEKKINKENLIKISRNRVDFDNWIYHNLLQEKFNKVEFNYEYKINCDEIDFMLIDKIYTNTEKLGKIVDLPRGLEIWSNSDLIWSYNTGDVPILVWKNIAKYCVKFDNLFLNIQSGSSFIKDLSIYQEKKILIQRIRNLSLKQRIVATYDSEWLICTNTLRMGILKNDNYDLKYLLSILNSSLINYIFRKFFLNKDIYAYQLDVVPIKCSSLIQQKPLIDLVNQILTVKKDNNKADTSKLEKEIDQMIYKLYGLTEEEIKVVEESVK